jgi:hypothetical protein
MVGTTTVGDLGMLIRGSTMVWIATEGDRGMTTRWEARGLDCGGGGGGVLACGGGGGALDCGGGGAGVLASGGEGSEAVFTCEATCAAASVTCPAVAAADDVTDGRLCAAWEICETMLPPEGSDAVAPPPAASAADGNTAASATTKNTVSKPRIRAVGRLDTAPSSFTTSGSAGSGARFRAERVRSAMFSTSPERIATLGTFPTKPRTIRPS